MPKKYDILLINPSPVPDWDYKKKYSYSVPAGILSIATVLNKEGYSVKLIDGAYEEDYLEKIKEVISSSNILFAGISAMTSQVSSGLKAAECVRKHNRGIKLVWGGVHPSLFSEQTAMHELTDIVVFGEGEYTSLELSGLIRDKRDYTRTKGTICKIGGKLIKNDAREFLDLESLPFFDYQLLEIERYIPKDRTDVGGRRLRGGHIRRSLPILSGLGCPYKCGFCVEPIMKRKYRQRSAKSMIGEIERVVRSYGVNDIAFNDPLFFANRKRLFEFLDLLEERKIDISWSGTIRANYFEDNYLNPTVLKRIRSLGGFHLGLGVESGSERILKKINKQISKEDALRCAKLCKEADINLVYSFIIGFPGETASEIKETIGFAFRLVDINPENSYLNGPNIFRPYPGSNLFRECVERYGFKVPATPEEWGRVYSVEEGYFRLENIPWIKDPRTIRILAFYLFRGTTNFVYSVLWIRFLFGILKKICRLRLRLNFFLFPIEYEIFDVSRVIMFRIKKKCIKIRGVIK